VTRYGISSWIVRDVSVDEAIDGLADAGFTEAELSGTDAPLVRGWESDPVGIRERLNAAGIDAPSVHSPESGRRLDAEDDAERRASMDANVEYFRAMVECGMEMIVIHATGAAKYSTEQDRQAGRARSMDSLRVLADEAGKAGVRMAVENLGGDKRPDSGMADLLGMIDGLGDHVGLCFDIGHAEQAGFDLVQELRTATAEGKLFSLHMHDVNPEGRDHFIPGEGRIDFDVFLAELDASGSPALRTLEISPPETDVPQRLQQAARLRDEWSRR